ncbi:MAG: hypothetical protein Q8940_19605 [Bacteroidota bacterium]|nr:hypothetical protein [Bacteroidota bacterium]
MNKKEQDSYLLSTKTNKLAIDYYKKRFKISDDTRTIELLNILTTKNEEMLPFYFFIFNDICSKSDGAFSELMGPYCIKMALAYPEYVVGFFSLERLKKRRENKMLDYYSLSIGEELYFSEQGLSDIGYTYSSFSKILNDKNSAFNEEDKKSLNIFLNKIKDSMKNMD